MGWSAALVADLLFGSRLQGALEAGGFELELAADGERLSQVVAARGSSPDALIVDLGDPSIDLDAALAAVTDSDAATPPATLGFYSHVHPEQRDRGERAGFDLVVPRSRLAREATVLVASLRAR